MSKYGFKYRLEVTHWTRSRDGDDWIDTMYWLNFNDLSEALAKAKDPFSNKKDLISSELYSMIDSRDLIYSKDWISGKEQDFTMIPDFDYHNREYDT